MKKLDKPTDKAVDIYKKCFSTTNKANKEYYESKIGLVSDQTDKYIGLAGGKGLFNLPKVFDKIEPKKMKYLYKEKFVSKKGICRNIYDRLFLIPTDSICPFCLQRQVSTIDHFLPKSKHPELAVSPVNLIPSCKDCNYEKSEYLPSSLEDEIFHPYFDDFGDGVWLEAHLNIDLCSLKFKVSKPTSWNDQNYKRAKKHFEIFKLSNLYTVHSARELRNINNQLTILAERGGPHLANHLLSQLESYEKNNPNSWQTAMYRTLHSSTDFHRHLTVNYS